MPDHDSFDFSSASAAAIQHLDAPPAADPTPPTPPPADPAAPATPTGTPAGQVATKTYKVKVDGQEFDVPEDELVSGYSRTAKFTQSMMTLAEQRKAFETERQQALVREQQLNEFFRVPDNIARYYEHLTGQKLTPAQQQAIAQTAPASDEFATLSQVDRLAADKAAMMQQQVAQQVQRQLQETQRWTSEQIEKARIEAQQERRAVEYHGEITSTVSSLLDQYPVLRAVDNIEEVLALDAHRMGPNTLDEAKSALLNVAKARAEKLDSHFKEMQKKSAVEQTKLQTQGIEPPGGTGVAPSPTSFKLGDKNLTKAAAEWLEKSSKKK